MISHVVLDAKMLIRSTPFAVENARYLLATWSL